MSDSAYPRLTAYLASLPQGLASHPECTCLAEVLVEVLQVYPGLAARPGLPPLLSDAVRRTWSPSDTAPETINVALRLLLRDTEFASDAHYIDFIEKLSAKVFAKPMYRMLMYVMSPTLVLMGAEKRWARFRKGTVLRASPRNADGSVGLTLTYPHHLYPGLALETFAASFRAALRATGAQGVNVALRDHDATVAHYLATWS